jgi:hypothetical protein
MLNQLSLANIPPGPADILFADKASIQKILIDEDFRKSRDYERVREDPYIASLITETDKVKYKQKVIRSSRRTCRIWTDFRPETSLIPCLLDQLFEWARATHA